MCYTCFEVAECHLNHNRKIAKLILRADTGCAPFRSLTSLLIRTETASMPMVWNIYKDSMRLEAPLDITIGNSWLVSKERFDSQKSKKPLATPATPNCPDPPQPMNIAKRKTPTWKDRDLSTESSPCKRAKQSHGTPSESWPSPAIGTPSARTYSSDIMEISGDSTSTTCSLL